MTHVVTENCIHCKNTDCVDVCPVDCFRETPLMLVIDPEECIDCAVCVAECPTNAILAEEDLPLEQNTLIKLNAKLSISSPSIIKSKAPLPTAEAWRDIRGKALLLELDSITHDKLNTPENEANYKKIITASTLSPKEWRNLLIDEDPMVRMLAATRQDFILDRKQLIRGLSDINESIRKFYLTRSVLALKPSDIDTLLNDPSASVRIELVRAKSGNLTPIQQDKALCDSNIDVRVALINSKDFFPTEEQFFRILEKGSTIERQAMLTRIEPSFLPRAISHASAEVRSAAYGHESFKLSADEVSVGLSDPDQSVRHAIVSRQDFKPSPAIFYELLTQGNPRIIDVISGKADQACLEAILDHANTNAVAQVVSKVKTTTTAQLKRCLAKDQPQIVFAALNRLGDRLTNNQLSICLQSNHEHIREKAVAQFNMAKISPVSIEKCLSDPSSKIRSLVVGSAAVKLSMDQLNRSLKDKAGIVRLAVANRLDFLPNVEQFEQGTTDRSRKVREIFFVRFKKAGRRVVNLNKEIGQLSIGEKKRRLNAVLDELSQIHTWTARKYQLKKELESLLSILEYIHFTVDSRRAWFTQFGIQTVIDVPINKRGPLQSMRGKKAHIVCLGTAPYSSAFFAAKVVKTVGKS